MTSSSVEAADRFPAWQLLWRIGISTRDFDSICYGSNETQKALFDGVSQMSANGNPWHGGMRIRRVSQNIRDAWGLDGNSMQALTVLRL